MNRVSSIELMRGLAAISVMCFHYSIGRDVPIFGTIFAHGHIGVDLFFLISGFVIYVSTENDRSAGRFLIRRAFRIFPLAWICLGIAYAIMPPLDHSVPFFYDLLLLPDNTASNPPIYSIHVLPVLWSISYELLFYAVFAAALLIGRARAIVTSLWLLAIVTIGQGTPFITLDAQAATLIGRPFYANPMLLYFPIGMFGGFIFVRGSHWGLAAALAGIAIGSEFLAPSYGLTRIGLVAVPIFFLLLHIPAGRLAALGSLTYAIYLIHPLIEPAIGNAHPLLERAFVSCGSAVQIAILIGMTLGLSYTAHIMIERPFNWLGRALIEQPRLGWDRDSTLRT